MAQNSTEIATSLAARGDIPDDLKASIYTLVGKELKNSLSNTEESQEALAPLLNSINEIVEEVSGKNFYEPTDVMKSTAQRLQERGEITVDMMIGVLRRRQFPSFIAQFAEFTGQSTDVVARMLQQKSGQGLALSCKAMGIEKYDFVSIFLLTHTMRSSAQMADVSELGRAVEYFNRIDQRGALKLIRRK